MRGGDHDRDQEREDIADAVEAETKKGFRDEDLEVGIETESPKRNTRDLDLKVNQKELTKKKDSKILKNQKKNQ
jgi:hypothetical protein